MTLMQKFTAGLVLVLFLAVVGLTIAVQRQSRAAAEARRSAEAAELAAKNVTVARDASERQLRADLDAAKKEIRGFADALVRARKAAPKAKVIATVRASTGPVAVAASPAACVLKPGDKGQIDVASSELRTEAGNKVLVQAAQASRVDPDGSKVVLFGGELRADLTRYLTQPDPVSTADRKFGFGAIGFCKLGGRCMAGPLVESPVLFGHLTLGAGVLAGPDGAGVSGQLVLRF